MARPRTFASAFGDAGVSMRRSVAMTGSTQVQFANHLLRDDGQEDLCFGTWRPSTGRRRRTAILHQPILPRGGDRLVHGNASFEPAYLLRAAREAAVAGVGLAFMHSHPKGSGWQSLNETDRIAESRVANIAREVTGFPLVGLTLSGDRRWSARVWKGAGRDVTPVSCETVRTVGDTFEATFDDRILRLPRPSEMQVRTVHTWGEGIQAKIARLRVAVAGVGSVGMAIADVLARTGLQCVGVFDFDTVEPVNLDRLRGASRLDAFLRRSKADLARQLLDEGSTAAAPRHEVHELSICEPAGLMRLLDFDLIFSCVDRPWPRHVLNVIAHTDLIPVVEGGMSAFRNVDGSLRNAYWSSTVVRPGRPCLACLGQYDPVLVQVERDGSLDDPSYLANLPPDSPIRRRENVAATSTSVVAALLEQFVAYVAHPSGFGDPGPLRFSLRDHSVERRRTACRDGCPYARSVGHGDDRLDPTGSHAAAEQARRARATVPIHIAMLRLLVAGHRALGERLARFAR